MPKTTEKLGDFTVVETIGTGSFGTCRKISRKSDGKLFVWKEVDYGGMSEREKQLLVQEVNLLRELRHPHIVRYHDRIIDRVHSTLYIVTEYCEGGDLGQVISRCRQGKRWVEEEMVWKVLEQLLLALQECHKKRNGMHRVLHRDLKPANVFLDAKGDVKLGDFGLARVLHHNFSLAQTFVGTPYYMSPEVFSEQAYDEKSDLWSLGCLIHELCTLSPPFNAPDQQALAAKVLEGRVCRLPRHYSKQLQAIVDSLLVNEPSGRPDIPSLLERVDMVRRRKEGEDHSTEPDSATVGRKYQPRSGSSQDLAAWECELEKRERELLKREHRLIVKEAELARREKAIKEKEEVLSERDRQRKERKGLYLPHQLPEKHVQERRGQWAARKENIRYDLHPTT